MPSYGKEWNWRNVKMEARDQDMVLPAEGRKRDILL